MMRLMPQLVTEMLTTILALRIGTHVSARDLLKEAWDQKRDSTPAWLTAWRDEHVAQRGKALKRKPFVPASRRKD